MIKSMHVIKNAKVVVLQHAVAYLGLCQASLMELTKWSIQIQLTTKSRELFLQKSSIIDV